jgi:hypothetical protein
MIEIKNEWNGTQTLLLDGEIILERKPKAEVEEKANVLRMALLFKGIDRVTPAE